MGRHVAVAVNEDCNPNITAKKFYLPKLNGHHYDYEKNGDPDMRNCKSIEELTQLAYNHKYNMSPRGMSAYWAIVFKHLSFGDMPTYSKQMQIRIKLGLPQYYNNMQTQMQIDQLIGKSLRDIERYNPRDLATTAISLAKIMDNVRKSEKTKGSMEQILQEVLIGNNSQNRYLIFNRLAAASAPILHTFHARSLSDVTYAFGLAEAIIPIKGGRTFFDILADAAIVIPNLQHFNSQDLSNMLWAYANVGVLQWALFKKVADHITIRFDYHHDAFKPHHLSNIVWSYATLNEKNPKLFEKVADHIVGLYNI